MSTGPCAERVRARAAIRWYDGRVRPIVYLLAGAKCTATTETVLPSALRTVTQLAYRTPQCTFCFFVFPHTSEML